MLDPENNEVIAYALLDWIKTERAVHAATKYSDGMPGRTMLVEEMQTEGFGEKWQDFVGNYLKRAELLGLDTPNGRQAMGKAICTLLHCLETAMYVHGDLPQPGLPSGEIRPWNLQDSAVITVDGSLGSSESAQDTQQV